MTKKHSDSEKNLESLKQNSMELQKKIEHNDKVSSELDENLKKLKIELYELQTKYDLKEVEHKKKIYESNKDEPKKRRQFLFKALR